MASIIETAREYGRAAAQKNMLMQLARAAALAASTGEIDESDANAIYAEYVKGSRRVSKVDPAEPTFKVQASKLRAIIKASHRNKRALRTFERAEELYYKCDGADVSLYSACVTLARMLNMGREITDRHILAVIKKLARLPRK